MERVNHYEEKRHSDPCYNHRYCSAFVIWVVSGYNALVAKNLAVENAYSNIQSQLQRRADLIPNVVNTVKGYAAHETAVFNAVNEARTKMMGAQTPADSLAADGELTQALGRLFAISEAYPELKASENFAALQDELEGSENRVNTARLDYNEAVKSLNTKIRSFPSNLIAGMFGFSEKEMFQAQESAQQVPQVNFD